MGLKEHFKIKADYKKNVSALIPHTNAPRAVFYS
jgi:hypothetical protein